MGKHGRLHGQVDFGNEMQRRFSFLICAMQRKFIVSGSCERMDRNDSNLETHAFVRSQ